MIASEAPTYIDLRSPIMRIDCSQAFQTLTQKEKLYAYYFSRASWEGAKICYFQRSYESPALFYIINKIFSLETLEKVKERCYQKLSFTEDDWKRLTAYLAGFLQNCGNYLSFGDKKFIPEIPKEKFWAFISSSEAYKLEPQKIENIWKSIELEIYTYTKPYNELGFTDEGCLSSMYSPTMSRADCKFIHEFVTSVIWPMHTRVAKLDENTYQVLVCGYQSYGKAFEHQGKKIAVKYGDFSSFMYKVVHYLKECQKYAANENQSKMIKQYIDHFWTGNLEHHKQAQIIWVKDKNPAVETNIGFIEAYHDPMKIRGEFEGFVAVVHKEKSQRLNTLVDYAEQILPKLPWPREFENDKFCKPNFTSLDILTFACSGTPIGINLPNYDDVARSDGFKNVNLGNCYPKLKKGLIHFTLDQDIETIVKYTDDATFLTVALHELLGHGSGKIFYGGDDDNFNFDKDTLIHPITGGPITSWYKGGETMGSKFGKISSAYEECRADSIALFLSCFTEVLEILLPGRENEWDDIVYTAWFNMASAGLKGLPFFSLDLKQWGQAHMCGRYAIFQVLREAGNNFIIIEETQKDGVPYFYFKLDRSQIKTTGKKTMAEFIKGLQVYKSTGDAEEGSKFFNHYINVDDELLKYRQIIVNHKIPRRIELQDEVFLEENGEIKYVQFDETFEGVIKSHLAHHRDSFEDVYPIWEEYKDFYRYKPNLSN